MNRRGSTSTMPLIFEDSVEYREAVNADGHLPQYQRFDQNDKEFSRKEEETDSDDDSGIQMKKQLGVLDGIGIIVGIMVGSGIFISPRGVVEYSQSVGMALVVWAASGILSTVGALCYAELGTMIPKSGGDYAYISEAFGPLLGFLYLWVALIIIMPTGNTVIALTFAYYILKPLFPHCENPPDTAVKLVAALVILFLTWVNCTNVKAATKIQDIFTLTKILALSVIIITGIYYLATGHVENYQDPFGSTNWHAGSIATSFYQGLFSFAGWNSLNFVVEEMKDPYRNLPRAIMISLPLVTLIYFLVNMAYFSVLTANQVTASNAVAVTFGNMTLGSFSWIIPVFVACSTFGCLNGAIFSSSRLYYVGARDGHLPDSLGLINIKAFTPVPALVFLGLLTIIMLLTSDVQMLINYVSFSEAIFIFLSVTALLWMRYRYPHIRRPIKVWIVIPIVFFIVSIFLVVLPVIEKPLELGVAAGLILSGIPVYYFFISKPSDRFSRCKSGLTSVVQLLTNSLPED
ncbi:UNVERIFIED_CONTAM: hypothetical protein RMT77_000854 [Armadillidium vulgare]